MKSGLEGRNNPKRTLKRRTPNQVSMKSGLEGRNNPPLEICLSQTPNCLNEVRPRRPEQ